MKGVVMAGHGREDNSSYMNSSILTTPQWSRARKLSIHEFMPRENAPARNRVIAERLVLAREAVGLKQGHYAAMADISATAYNQWENAAQAPDVYYAIKLCDRHGLTLDWIYRGKFDGLPTRLSDAIRGLQAARAQQTAAEVPMKVVEPRRRRAHGAA
jgi:DNA-binding XRE family transcriptional regulator